MKTADFIREHHACRRGAEWALSTSDDMADVWDAMIKQNRHDWLLWAAIRPGVFPDSVLRKLACRFVRETPLSDGRTVWDLLTDDRSRKAIEVTEAYVDGNATEAELAAAWAAACDAYSAANAAARAALAAARAALAAAYTAACVAADAAADAAASDAASDAADSAACAAYADACAAANAAQARMIAELGNPFKEGKIK